MLRKLRSRIQRFEASLHTPRRRQAGALCWRRSAASGEVEILFVTTRRTGRWTPPKGNPIDGISMAEVAAVEAWEEAGVIGAVDPEPIGAYDYMKMRKNGAWERMAVDLFPLRVETIEPKFPEAGERRMVWAAKNDAALMVKEGSLSVLISGFTPPEPAAAILTDYPYCPAG